MKIKVLLFLLWGTTAWAANTWKALGPYGGQIYPLYVNQNDQLYAQFSGKLWTSSDLGKTWRAIFQNCRFFRAGDNGNLYAEDLAGGVHVSTDMGSSWQALPKSRADMNLERMAISATGTLYLANGAEVYVSQDAASTWKFLPHNFENSAESVVLGANIYVFGKSRLFRSTDGGATWQRLYTSSVDIQDFMAINANELLLSIGTESAGNIYKSTDGGGTWGITMLPYARRLFFAAPNWLMGASAKPGAAAVAKSFVSSNGGANSRQVDVGLPILALAASSKGVLFAASVDGLWSSADGGAVFTAVSPNAANVRGMVSTSGGVLFAVTENAGKFRFWRSGDTGVLWSEINKKTTLGEPSHFFDLQVLPDNRLWLLLGYASGSDRSVIYESRDGGASWTTKRKSPLEFTGFTFDKSANTAYTWDVGGKVFYRSGDYGGNWLPKAATFNICCLMPASNGLLYALAGTVPEQPSGLYRSFNNGDAWEPQINITEPEGYVASFCTNKFGDLFKVVSKVVADKNLTLTRIQRSVDFGTAWQDITPKEYTSTRLLAGAKIVADDNGALFLYASAVVLMSLDNGDTWTVFFSGQNVAADARSFFTGGGAAYVGTFANSIFSTARTPVLFTPQNLSGIEYPLVKTYGVHWVDYDGDGRDDLFLVNEGQNELYRNTGDAFKKIISGEIVSDNEPSRAACWGDYNNDGYPDLFVANSGAMNSLYRNLRDGTFTKITSGNIVEDRGNFKGCAWGDVNKDGFLDLYLTRVDGANILYIATGTGHFTKSTANIIGSASDRSYGCAWADFDNDGDLDLYVCNDGPDQLWEQVSPMKFSPLSLERITPNTALTVGCSWQDVNNDGYLDLFVTNANAETPNRLYLNNGNGTFRIAGGVIGTDAAVSKGSGWADFDNDGDLDLLISNNGSHFMYRNNGGVFERESTEFIYFGGNSLSLAWADFDNDGDLDVVISSFDRKNILYKNSTSSANKWLKIKCEGSASNKQAIGAHVRVKAVIGGRAVWQTREISTQTGYLAQNSIVQHFGLGDAARVDSITVIWPSGRRQSLANAAVNQIISIVEAGGAAVETAQDTVPLEYRLENYPNPFNGSTTLRFELPHATLTKLEIFDAAGRRVRTLLDNTLPAGAHTFYWDGRDDQGVCPSGLYFAKLTTAPFSQIIKMTVLK